MTSAQTVVLKPSRSKWLFIAGVLGMCALLGVFLIVKQGNWLAWLTTLLFGSLAIVSVLNLLPGRVYLLLNQEGFTVRTLTYTAAHPWRDIEAFGVARVGRNQQVAFRFSREYSGRSKLRTFDRAIMGYEGALPDTYDRDAPSLAQLMNEWKAHYSRR